MSFYPSIKEIIKERKKLNKREEEMKDIKTKANPEGDMPRHKAMAMGKKIKTGAKQKPAKRKK